MGQQAVGGASLLGGRASGASAPACFLVRCQGSATSGALRASQPQFPVGTTQPKRWLPVNALQQAGSHSPRAGWQLIERWRGQVGKLKSAEGIGPEGCSALVRTLRSALRPPPGALPVTAGFWRHATARGGRMAEFLSPEESCEFLSTLADARLQWRTDAASTRGLRKFATYAAEEIGSYTSAQRADLAMGFARLGYFHEDFMQALSRSVEHTVRAERGRLSNATACKLLTSFQKLGVLDEPVMKSLSRLICRRLVREPLTPDQTAGVVAAYAHLRVRDLALFNATTLALCRPGVVEALGWPELATVAVSYASLRFHSASLFSRIRSRVCSSIGVTETEVEACTESNLIASDPNHSSEVAAATGATGAWVTGIPWLLQQFSEAVPPPPRIQWPGHVTRRFLEAHVHLGHLSAKDLAPLLPHLVHPEGSRPGTDAAALLAVALSRGGHVWPWLWRRAVTAFTDERLHGRGLLASMDALHSHLKVLEPLLLKDDPEDLRTCNQHGYGCFVQHLQAVARTLAQIWGHLVHRGRALSDGELKQMVVAVCALWDMQASLLRALGSFGVNVPPLERASASVARQLGVELKRRRVGAEEELSTLLRRCDVTLQEVNADVQLLALDALNSD